MLLVSTGWRTIVYQTVCTIPPPTGRIMWTKVPLWETLLYVDIITLIKSWASRLQEAEWLHQGFTTEQWDQILDPFWGPQSYDLISLWNFPWLCHLLQEWKFGEENGLSHVNPGSIVLSHNDLSPWDEHLQFSLPFRRQVQCLCGCSKDCWSEGKNWTLAFQNGTYKLYLENQRAEQRDKRDRHRDGDRDRDLWVWYARTIRPYPAATSKQVITCSFWR